MATYLAVSLRLFRLRGPSLPFLPSRNRLCAPSLWPLVLPNAGTRLMRTVDETQVSHDLPCPIQVGLRCAEKNVRVPRESTRISATDQGLESSPNFVHSFVVSCK